MRQAGPTADTERRGSTPIPRTANFRIEPQAVEGDLIWTPRFSWSLGGTVVATAQQGQDQAVDLSEAFLTYKPLLGGGTRIVARAGLFWPPVSLEHTGPEWRVRDTITPSAINSWIGEEVKVGGLEAQVDSSGRRRTAERDGRDLRAQRHRGHVARLSRLGAARPESGRVRPAAATAAQFLFRALCPGGPDAAR